MTKQIVCPQCHTTYTIPEEQDGKKVKCKKCATVFTAGAGADRDVPAAKEIRPKPPEPDKPAAEPASRRKRVEVGEVVASRRRERYEEDDDYRPRPRKTSGLSALGLFLILGGVFGSLLIIVGSVVFVMWYWNAASTKPTQLSVADMQQHGGAPDMPEVEREDNHAGDAGAKEVEVKNVDPPPPPPRELVFISPTPKEAANAPKAPANAELAQEVVDKVKKATVHLRVTMGDGGVGQGSGFFALQPNIIVTNAHVVGMLQADNAKPKNIEVTQNSGIRGEEKKFPAELLGVDRQVDLAVLRVKGSGFPAPLLVNSAHNLRQTQRIWVVGFPLGDMLGKEVTVSGGTISSKRFDDNGILAKVQVQGDMQPGNSGGPVIDALGNVIGVSVSILRGTQINFAVPGDWVLALGTGRISRLTVGQPYVKDGNLRLPISMHMIDPLKRIHLPGIEVWTGKPAAFERAPSMSQPATEAGDSPHQRHLLDYQNETAKGDIPLAPLTPGSAYWIQPAWGDGPANMQWASAQPCELPPPVDLKAALLAIKHHAGSRNVTLNKWLKMKVSDPQHGEFSLNGSEETQLMETIQAVDPQEQANVALQYRNFNEDLKIENQSRPRNAQLQKLLDQVKNIKAFVLVDKEGDPANRDLDVEHVAPDCKAELTVLHEGVEQMLEGLLVPFPNKSVSPGYPWQRERIFPLSLWQADRTIPFLTMNAVGHKPTLLMSYTYVGSRTRNNHEEAVVTLRGKVPGGRPNDAKSGASAEGSAVIDLTSGLISEADVLLSFDAEISALTMQPGGGQFVRHPIKANGTLRVRLRRTPASASSTK